MKMSVGCCYTLLLVFIAVTSGVAEVVKVGGEVRFKPDITAGSSLKDSSITWKYTKGVDVIKVIEWDNDFQSLETLNPKFQNRVALDRNNGELTIRDLKLNDTGSYSIEINNIEKKRISLTVKESVPKPTLISEKTDNNVNAMYLRCKYDTTIKIRWNCSYGETPQKIDTEKPGQEEAITFERSGIPDVCCTCILFNDVSEESSNPICRKTLFADSGNGFLWILCAIVIFIIFISFIILLFCCVECVHDLVYEPCKDTRCVGVIVVFLHGHSRFKDQTTGQHRADSNTNGNTKENNASDGAKEEDVPFTSNQDGQTDKL